MENITHLEFNFQTKDNLKLYAQAWKSDQNPKAVICLVHGHGEHSGRYEELAGRFNKRGLAFCGFDLRGHGKSEGKRGHSPSYPYFIDDYIRFQNEVRKLFPDTPVVLYGHSMGGSIALVMLLRHSVNVNAAIVTSPWIKLAMTPSAFKVGLAKAVRNILPGLVQSTGLDANSISQMSDEVKAYTSDPLVHDKISVATFTCVYKAGLWILNNASKLQTPLLIIHGTGDKITSHNASVEFVEKAGELAQIKLWEGLYHETHHEKEREEIFNYIMSWLDKFNF